MKKKYLVISLCYFFVLIIGQVNVWGQQIDISGFTNTGVDSKGLIQVSQNFESYNGLIFMATAGRTLFRRSDDNSLVDSYAVPAAFTSLTVDPATGYGYATNADDGSKFLYCSENILSPNPVWNKRPIAIPGNISGLTVRSDGWLVGVLAGGGIIPGGIYEIDKSNGASNFLSQTQDGEPIPAFSYDKNYGRFVGATGSNFKVVDIYTGSISATYTGNNPNGAKGFDIVGDMGYMAVNTGSELIFGEINIRGDFKWSYLFSFQYALGPVGAEVVDNRCTDHDGDGFSGDGFSGDGYSCGVIDCNDSNVAVSPGVTEICGDGIDQNCDGSDLVCKPNISTTGDVNGDSKGDLIVSDGSTGISWRDSATGTWSSILDTSYSISYLGSADINGDNLEDIVVSGYSVANKGLHWRDSVTGIWNEVKDASYTPSLIAFGDINGDGKDDIVIGGKGLSCWNSATNTWNEVLSISFTVSSIISADINGDGKDDIVIDIDGYGLYWRDSNSGAWNKVLDSFFTLISSMAADINGDGKDDIIINIEGYGLYWRDSNSGAWNKVLDSFFTLVSSMTADINGDGKDDIVTDIEDYGLYWRDSNSGAWNAIF